MLLIDIISLLIALTVLVISGRLIVRLLSRIAVYIGLTEFIISFVLMAFATSIPELFIGINSAINHIPILALGNVIGANILNLTLIIGVVALLTKNITLKESIKENLFFMFILSTLPIILIWFGRSLSRLDGLVLISIFIWYIYRTIKEKRKFTNILNEKNNVIMNFFKFMNNIALFILTAMLLFLSSYYVVKYASSLAADLGVSTILIGLFLVAIGTTLPELTFGVMSALAKKGEMAVGDSIGSVICNSTLILGVTALIYPISNDFMLLFTSLLFMLFSVIIFILMVRKSNTISWKKGLILLFVYILFILLEFYLK
ncbi:MAG: sodium:calcium antiporter [Nanoarchaeota archaeon]